MDDFRKFSLLLRLQREIADVLKVNNNEVDLNKVVLLNHDAFSQSILTYDGKRIGEIIELENDFRFFADKPLWIGSDWSSTPSLIP